jgi:hypothetical protein
MQRRFLMPMTLLFGLLAPLLVVLLMPLAGTRPAGAQEESDEAQDTCPAADQALVGVWGPGRLGMLAPCQQASGTVSKVEPEPDGDLDLYVDLDPDYDHLAGSIVELNFLHQWGPGDVIVEFMPRDGGHLPAPSEGDHLDLTGAWVSDKNHGYNEIHPVWAVSINGGDIHESGPENGGSLPQSTSQTAAADCKDEDSNTCIGYS